MKNLSLIFLFILGIFFTACDEDKDDIIPDPTTPETALIKTESDRTVDAVYTDIKNNINAKGLSVMLEVDHGQAAQNIGIDLRPTRLIVFGDPATGTQLIQSDQRFGIELPLKILVYEEEDGETTSAYYNASFLTDNFDIEDQQTLVQNINQSLADITGSGEPDPTFNIGKDRSIEMETMQSTASVADTYDRIKQAINDRGLNIMAEIDHSANASNVGMSLRPTRLIIFGNPQAGSQLMTSNQEIGIDLPLKILVWENANGETWLGYYPADYLADIYDIDDREEVVTNIDNTLQAITTEAITE